MMTMQNKRVVPYGRIGLLLIVLFILFANHAFAKTLSLPTSIDIIESEAFYGDGSLDVVELPDGISSIGARAFASSSVGRINLPDSIVNIADDAFEGCENIIALVGENGYPLQYCIDHSIPYVIDSDYYVFPRRDDLQIPGYCFATEIVSFTHGTPWTPYPENQDPAVVLGKPDYIDYGSTATGDLTLGADGELVVKLGSYIYNGPGNDLFVFEIGEASERFSVHISNDLENWYDVGIASGSDGGIDIYGKAPASECFQYVKLIDLRTVTGGDWPGADIDAVCALNYKLRDDGKYTFQDRFGRKYNVSRDAFAVEVIDFEHGNPWTVYENNKNPILALGLPDYLSSNPTSSGDLNLGANGTLTLRLGVFICDGSGDDLYIVEVGPNVEDVRVEVSNDLETWYDVGTANGDDGGIDISGKTPRDSCFQYVRMTDLRTVVYGDHPGADIDAVFALNYMVSNTEASE